MSKVAFNHPPEPANAKKYWRSLDQLSSTPQFNEWLEREFPQGAAEFNFDGVTRRNFLQIMGASAALAGLVGCRRPEMHLVPFSRSPEWAIPGKALFYATSMPARRGSLPLIVTTFDGRPTKVEGNPLHPFQSGGTDVWAQASVLNLYDPDRSKSFLNGGTPIEEKWFVDFLDKAVGELSTKGGEGLAFIVEADHSPTRERLRKLISQKMPRAQWCVFEAGYADHTALNAAAYGPGVSVRPALENADVVVALDSDFLSCNEGDLQVIKAFSDRRRVKKAGDKMNRLYVVENRYTVTGGMADHRLRLPVSHIGAFALALAEKLGANVSGLSAGIAKASFDEKWLAGVAEDLKASRGRSAVLAGERQPAAVQLIVAAINEALGNLGKTLVGMPVNEAPATLNLAKLKAEIDSNRITHLFILGGNPVYNAPADLDWTATQAKVPNVVRLGLHEDETSKISQWHVPAAHYMEYWGDGRSADGTYVSIQPMILPLYGGWSELDLLARVAGLPKPKGPELVQDTFREIARPADFADAWNKFLHDGFLADSAQRATALSFNASGAADFAAANRAAGVLAGEDAMEVVLVPDAKVDDGRYNNNGWLQELPEPITKLTWDNAAQMSLATARKLGVSTIGIVDNFHDKDMGVYDREIIEIAFDDGRKLEIPALISPGHADNSITISLGYGRTATGSVGVGTGVNAYPMKTTTQPYFGVGAKVRRTGKFHELAITQDHYSMEGRALVRETTAERFATETDRDYIKKYGMDAHVPGNVSLYNNPPLNEPNQWGMVVDLNTCTGCLACVVACQAENNIPIVGKEQVINGRSMHWIRLDRYFGGEDIDNPDMVTQPMMCQHCENAPCETVCPVNATIHSEDGLNLMAYNRCIGTRYCANNCPFKVRRFNFFDYQQRKITELKKWNLLTEKGSPDTLKMQKNPNVSVRMRGVMEKCTFCIQRIQEAKIAAKAKAGASEYKGISDKFMVACQQACPANAITFGDVKDKESAVSKLKEEEKNYRLLEYLNVNTRVSYLARLRNPNMAMPGAEKIGLGDEHHGHGGEQHESHAAKQEGAHS